MPRKKMGITLANETLKRLDILCEQLGLTKSQAIAYSINKIFMDKFENGKEREKSNENK